MLKSEGSAIRNRCHIAVFNIVLYILLVIVSSCSHSGSLPTESAGTRAIVPNGILPSQLSGGFLLLSAPERYGPNNLWKKIDGAADLFLSYGFRELLAGGFARSGATLPELEVSMYEMGDDLNATGVYQQEKSQEAETIAVGWEGNKSGDGLFFHKGPYYVKIIDLSKEGSLGALAADAAQRIDKAIRVPRQSIPEMTVFPSEGLVADSILYVHRDALGHGFLQRVFQANYAIAGKTATLFYCRQKEADQLLAKYRDYGKEFGQIEREWRDGDLHFLSFQAFNNPELVFVRGDVFGGVVGCPDQPTALRLIRALLENVDRRFGRS